MHFKSRLKIATEISPFQQIEHILGVPKTLFRKHNICGIQVKQKLTPKNLQSVVCYFCTLKILRNVSIFQAIIQQQHNCFTYLIDAKKTTFKNLSRRLHIYNSRTILKFLIPNY